MNFPAEDAQSIARIIAVAKEVFGEESRSNHKQFLFWMIAWRIQALAEGGLSELARRRALEPGRRGTVVTAWSQPAINWVVVTLHERSCDLLERTRESAMRQSDTKLPFGVCGSEFRYCFLSYTAQLRRARELTRVCSPRATLHAR